MKEHIRETIRKLVESGCKVIVLDDKKLNDTDRTLAKHAMKSGGYKLAEETEGKQRWVKI